MLGGTGRQEGPPRVELIVTTAAMYGAQHNRKETGNSSTFAFENSWSTVSSSQRTAPQYDGHAGSHSRSRLSQIVFLSAIPAYFRRG